MSLFDENVFPATSEADWRERISREQAGRNVEAALRWNAEAGLVLDAVAASLPAGAETTVEAAEIAHAVPGAEGARENAWSILGRDVEANDGPTVVLDVDSKVSPIHTAIQQCAIAAAMLHERAKMLRETRRVQAVVPVSHRLVVEVAKLMAMRRLLRNVASTSAGLAGEKNRQSTSTPIKLHALAAGSCECPDPETHQIRLTYACLASILGAADAILPASFEDSEESRRLATNVLLILRHEAGLTSVQTIAKGSYYLERAASRIEEGAQDLLARITNVGGLEAAFGEGVLTPVGKVDGRPREAGT